MNSDELRNEFSDVNPSAEAWHSVMSSETNGKHWDRKKFSRKSAKQIVFVCSLVSSIFLAVTSISEIVNALMNSGLYPFGSDFFGSYSIYKSQAKYVTFHSIVAVLLLLTFHAAWKKYFRLYWSLVAAIFVVLMYAVMTN